MMTDEQALEDAHNKVPTQNLRLAKLLNGGIKSFIELENGDIFQSVFPTGMDMQFKADGNKWYKVNTAPYLNEHKIVTVGVEVVTVKKDKGNLIQNSK